MPKYRIPTELRLAVRNYLKVDLDADSFAEKYAQTASSLYRKLGEDSPVLDSEEYSFLKDTLSTMIQEDYSEPPIEPPMRVVDPDYDYYRDTR